MDQISEFLTQWRDDTKSFIVAHTSGSTGTPKDIHLDKEFVKASARRTIRYFNIKPSHRLHLPLSCQYIAGKMMVVRCEESGAILTSEPPSNTPLLHNTDPTPIHLIAVVPSQMPWLLGHLHDLPHISHYLIGGAPLSQTLREEIARAGINAYESYGMTETASHIALRKVTPNDNAPFIPLPGCSVETDASGCLIIHIDGTTFHTHDLATLHSSGGFLIRGRKDNVINSGGIKILPEELEKKIASALQANGLHLNFMICGRKSIKWGHEVVMVIEGECPDTQIIDQMLRCYLPSTHIPKAYITLPSLPTTSNGKLIRNIDNI